MGTCVLCLRSFQRTAVGGPETEGGPHKGCRKLQGSPSSSGLGPRPFKAVARVRIPLGARVRLDRSRCDDLLQQDRKLQYSKAQWRSWLARRPVTAKVAGSSPVWVAIAFGNTPAATWPGSSVGTSD